MLRLLAQMKQAIMAKGAEIERWTARVAELEAKLALVLIKGLTQPICIFPSALHAPVPVSGGDGQTLAVFQSQWNPSPPPPQDWIEQRQT